MIDNNQYIGDRFPMSFTKTKFFDHGHRIWIEFEANPVRNDTMSALLGSVVASEEEQQRDGYKKIWCVLYAKRSLKENKNISIFYKNEVAAKRDFELIVASIQSGSSVMYSIFNNRKKNKTVDYIEY